MTHVYGNSVPLGFFHKLPALPGKPPAGFVGAGQRIFLIPGEGSHAKPFRRQALQPARVKANACRSLQGKYPGNLPPVYRRLDLRRCLCLNKSIRIFRQRPAEGRQGGNGTPIGASANVIGCAIAEKNGHRIGWGSYLMSAIPATLLVLVVCSIYLIVRYL